MRNKPRRRPWILALILLVLLGGGGAAYFAFGRGKSPTQVRTTRVVRLPELRQVVNGSGEIRTRDSVDIQAEIPGVIVELPVREGDRVKKGQVLLRIDPFQTETDVQAARAQLSALEAEAAGQDFQIASSEANRLRDEFQKKTAEVELAQANTNLVRAQSSARREKELLPGHLVSQEQFEVTETQVQLNLAQVEAARARIEQLTAQTRAAEAQIEYARTSREAIRKRVDGARSSLNRAEDLLRKTTITSTLDGVVVKLNVEVGERAVPGIQSNPLATLMTIADFEVIEAELRIDETDIVHVKVEDPARITVDALPEIPLAGKVVEIGNSPILASGSSTGGSQEGKDFKVVVRIADPPAQLRPGMSCEADITTEVKKEVPVVPIQSLTLRELEVDASGRYVPPAKDRAGGSVIPSAGAQTRPLKELQGVFLVGSGGAEVSFRPVKTGITGELDVEILEGLSEADEVVVGPFKALRSLKPGDRITLDKEHPYQRTSRKKTEEEEAR